MKIAISLNGIIRDLFGKIKIVHQKYYNSEIEGSLNYDNLQETLGFEKKDDLIEFLYREAPMEIFGHATEVQNNFIRNLNELVSENNEHTFTLISDEVGRAIPATFWFLAKYGCTIKHIRFYNVKDVDNLWEDYDLIFTMDESIIKSKPTDKLLYTFNESEHVDSEFILESPNKITNLNIFKKEHA